jgi:ubiquinone/menaquinone biosynthesis C-methylase UbiE
MMQLAAGNHCSRMWTLATSARYCGNRSYANFTRATDLRAAGCLVAHSLDSHRSFARIPRVSGKRNEEKHQGYVAEEVETIDKLLRYKPLKAVDRDEEDADMEGRPESSDDEDKFLESGDVDPRNKVAKALLSLGKITYRHVDPLPEWFLERQNEICQYRTNPQIRRCLKDWMIKHDRELLGKYREKTLQWGHKVSGKPDPVDLKVYGPEESIAYSNYYMPSRFGLLNRVLTELQRLAPEFVPKRTVDLGCGPGTAAAAIHDVWGEAAERYTGIDISQSMIDAARIMTRDKIRDVTFYTSNSEVVKRAATTGERYDLAVCSYTLSELPNDPSRRIAVQMLFELLEVGGYLVILEPGNPVGSHATRTARQFVLDTFNNVERSGRTPASMTGSSFYQPDQKTPRKKETRKPKPKKRGGSRDVDESGSDSDSDSESDSQIESSNSDTDSAEEEERAQRRDKQRAVRGQGVVTKDDPFYQQVEMLLDPPRLGGLSFDQLGAQVISPCTHDRTCPMRPGSWCSFSQKVTFLPC